MKRKSPVHITTRKKRGHARKQVVITVSLPQPGEILTAALLTLGFGGIVYSLAPLVFAPTGTTAANQAVASAAVEAKKPNSLDRSVPTRLRVPDVGIDTGLITLGKNADGSLAAPERYDIAGWYEYSPTPGEIGPSVIVGHVDNYLGPAVFYSLRELKPGQKIDVTRQDGSTVHFHVDSVELFDQQNFPTMAVYGNIDHAGLRLITCGGVYNPLTGRYSHNTVVYASMD
jgi:sortase (surface protein transpeptidase)